MLNPFKKAKSKASGLAMGMMARIAMKKMQKMSPQEQQKLMREAMDPKNKDKIMQMMDQMRSSGQISEEQYRLAKQRLGF
jgi:hypothetical protein